MKKNILMVVIGIVLAGAVIGGYYGYGWYQDNVSPIEGKLPSMTVAEFETKVANKESFYVYVGRPNCGDSDFFESWFIPDYVEQNDKIANYIYYMDIKDLQANDSEWNAFKAKYGIAHTPTLAFFDNGQMVDMIEWTAVDDFPESLVDAWLLRNDFIVATDAVGSSTNN